MAPKTHFLTLILSIIMPLVHGVGLACQRQPQGNVIDNTDCICAGASLIQNHINCDGNVIISDTSTLTYGCGSCTVGVTRYNGHGDLAFNAQLLQSWFAIQAVACTTGGFQTNSISGFFHKGSSKRDEASNMRWARRELDPAPNTLQARSNQCSGDSQVSVFNRCTLTIGAGLVNDLGRSSAALAGDAFDTLTTSIWRAMQSVADYTGQQAVNINNVPGDRVTLVADIAADAPAGTTWGTIVNTVTPGSLYSAIRAAVINANSSLQRTVEFILYDPNGNPLFRMSWNAWQELADNGPDIDDLLAILAADSDSD